MFRPGRHIARQSTATAQQVLRRNGGAWGLVVLLVSIMLAPAPSLSLAAEALDPKSPEYFQKQVRPVLAARRATSPPIEWANA